MSDNAANLRDEKGPDPQRPEKGPDLQRSRDPDKLKGHLISDRPFVTSVRRLKQLKSFLVEEGVQIGEDDIKFVTLGYFEAYRYAHRGRSPTRDEWDELDGRYIVLSRYLTAELKQRFEMENTPPFIAWMPLALLLFGLAALVIAIFVGRIFGWMGWDELATVPARFVCYLIWIGCLGGLGAIAFVSINALAIQTDATFDLTNRRLIQIRIVLGALFGVVLSIPFGFPDFVEFCQSIADSQLAKTIVSVGPTEAKDGEIFTKRAGLLLLPFILGFSTPLVVLILNRFVDGVSTLFGHSGGASKIPVVPIKEPKQPPAIPPPAPPVPPAQAR